MVLQPHSWTRGNPTDVYFVAEPPFRHGRVLLDIALVVIKGTILPRLQLICILDHFLIQAVQDGMVDYILQDDKTVTCKSPNCDFEIALAECAILDLGC